MSSKSFQDRDAMSDENDSDSDQGNSRKEIGPTTAVENVSYGNQERSFVWEERKSDRNSESPSQPFQENAPGNHEQDPEFDDSIPNDRSKDNSDPTELKRKKPEGSQRTLGTEKKIAGKKKKWGRKKRTPNNGGSDKEEEQAAPVQEENKEEPEMVKLIPPSRFESEDDADVKLSAIQKAPEIQLSSDLLTATSTKGYRMVRATRGVVKGTWYFEINITHLGNSGHVRLGWCTQRGDIQAPVGFDSHSYAYRDIGGSKVHMAKRRKYGEEFKEGDTIGCYIHLPESEKVPKLYNIAIWRDKLYIMKDEDAVLNPLQGSRIAFFKNGVYQGVAFENIFSGWYFPSASIYTLPDQEEGASVTFNFGPEFNFFPKQWFDLEPALPFSSAPKMPSPTSMISQFPSFMPISDGNEKAYESQVIQAGNQH